MTADVRATRVLLVRHGQSEWNAIGRWQGHADPPLSPLGLEQARAAAGAIGPVDAIVSSDLARARQTANLLAEGLGIGVVHVDARLRETDAGEWTGLTRGEIERDWPGFLEAGRRPPGFEPWERVAERARSALLDVARRHPGATVLAVAHGGVIRALERSLDALGAIVANLGGRWFHVTGDALHPGERVLLTGEGVAVTSPHQL